MPASDAPRPLGHLPRRVFLEPIIILARDLLGAWIASRFFSAGAVLTFLALSRGVLDIVVLALRYSTFRLVIDDRILVVEHRIFSKETRTIPIENIQDLLIGRTLTERLLGLSTVRVDTAGAGGAEAEINGLLARDAENLRRGILERRDRLRSAGGEPVAADAPAAEAAVGTRETPLRLGPVELAIAGAVAASPWLVGAAAISSWYFLEEFAPSLHREISERLHGFSARAQNVKEWEICLILPAFAVFARLVASVFDAFRTAWRLFDFRIDVDGDRLERSFGLVTRRRQTIRKDRIRRVTLRQNWFERLFGRMHAEIGGIVTYDRAETKEGGVFATPALPRARLQALLAAVGAADLDFAMPLTAVSPIARRRAWIVDAALAVTVLAILYSTGLRIAPFVAFALIIARAAVRAPRVPRVSGFAEDGDFLIVRNGAIGRSVTRLTADRLEIIALDRTILDRRLGLATVSAHAQASNSAALGNIPVATARALVDRLSARAIR